MKMKNYGIGGNRNPRICHRRNQGLDFTNSNIALFTDEMPTSATNAYHPIEPLMRQKHMRAFRCMILAYAVAELVLAVVEIIFSLLVEIFDVSSKVRCQQNLNFSLSEAHLD